MLFNSLEFAFFFPTVTLLYFLLPHRYRWILLLFASGVFYMALIPEYILILAFLIGVDYVAGLAIEKAEGRERQLFLAASIVANLSILVVFKYLNFINLNLANLAARLDWNYPIGYLSIVLPIGLSFHTFQSMSYTIEVYRGRQKAERHLGIYALYVMFYPQLVAGPIERPQNLLHQLYERHYVEYGRITDGLKLMAWGLFKKVVIADRLAMVVNQVYNHPTDYSGVGLIIATLFFTFQIYCDFSGYSDIAIGAARVMGFRLMRNFDRPYFSASIGEFWRRWHISLSSWFRDYVYIPLGGNRVARWRLYLNLALVFVISGFWHGANWTFLAWGALHGLYQITAVLTGSVRARLVRSTGLGRWPQLLKAGQVTMTFLLISFAWIFFRANSIADAVYITTHLFTGTGDFVMHLSDLQMVRNTFLSLGLGDLQFPVALATVGFLVLVEFAQGRFDLARVLAIQPAWVRWAVYYGLVLSILSLGVFSKSKFIYFQF